jgi:DnaK suppressor protein
MPSTKTAAAAKTAEAATPSKTAAPAKAATAKTKAAAGASSSGKPKDWIPTEAEVLQMPESEYMSPPQLRFFKQKLQQMEREILTNADETVEHLHENVVVPDPADRATIEEEHALELRTRDRERKLLKKVQQSITRIDAGDYGWCEETGDPIGVPRLLARPTATLSLEAQQRRELRQKMYGD